MKNILVLGAGLSASYLISYLLRHAERNDWFVRVGDQNLDQAREAVRGHPRGDAIPFDVNDSELRSRQIANADVVVYMLPPAFQHLVAIDCIHHGRHMVSASYQGRQLRDLNLDANRKGILLLAEMGLDPGIDHMIAMSMIQRVRARGGQILTFKSYGGALPAPESANCNPLRYFITWNPRNVVMAGEEGAQYLHKGKIKIVPFHHLFRDSWPVEIDGIGRMEVYPNRETLAYQSNFDINQADTIIRGTIRYPGWCETWSQVVRLGMPNEHLRIPGLHKLTYRDFVEVFIPAEVSGADLETRVANYLNISPTGQIMANLQWLGLFSDQVIGEIGETPAEVLIDLLRRKLAMPAGAQDMVVLYNEMEAEFPNRKKKREKLVVTLVEKGEAGGFTAITRTVGLPIAIAVHLLLQERLPVTGSHIPTHPAIYGPVLEGLEAEGLVFRERVVEV